LAHGSRDVSAVYDVLYNPNYTPKSSPTAHIETLELDGRPTTVLTKVSKAEYYEVDPTTEAIWRQLDGRKTVKEIFDQVKSLDKELTEKDVRDVIVSLAEEGVIESTEEAGPKGRIEVRSALQLNVHLIKDASQTLSGFFKVTRRVIRKQELPLAVGISIVGFVLFFTSFVRIFNNTSLLNVAGSALLGFFFYQLVILLPVYAVHELAHAAVCDYTGAKPRDMGTGLYYLSPFFYCDTSDSWRVSRKARIMISIAGPLSTVVIGSLFVFSSFFASGYPKDVLEIAAFFCFYGTLTNLSPVIETDGYYILADVLNMPNLRDESFSYVKRTVLRVLGRPAKAVRRSAKKRRIIAVYTVITVAWLAFFGYTTAWLFGIYGTSAYFAFASLGRMALGLGAFDLTTLGVDVATLAYFALIVAGFLVMGVVYYGKIRIRGVKLETIHDKRVSVFLPLPSDVQNSQSSQLVSQSERMARGYTRFFSVTLQPPLCVAELRLGKVDQSLDSMWEQMGKVEGSFRELHRSFLDRAQSQRTSPHRDKLSKALATLAESYPAPERKLAVDTVARYLKAQDERIGYVLQSAFGTVWSLELSPEDYRRIRRGMFPPLIAGDLSVNDLPGGVEEFKRRTVLGTDAMAKLSSEIEAESKEVGRNLEVYQTTVFIEPVKSRLVFVGRTDMVEGAVVWLGGLYLYQAWTGYIREALEEATLGLKSIRLAHPASMTPTQASKIHDGEVGTLKSALDGLGSLTTIVTEAIGKIESTFESSANFHEMLQGLVEVESVDVGLYRPILAANEEHLKGVKDKIEEFRKEFDWVAERVTASREVVDGELAKRTVSPHARSLLRRLNDAVSGSGEGGGKGHTQGFDSEIKLSFAITRMAYGVIVGSEAVL
jgi:Coenzyme PQQ synthesis protein D (PqqD)